MWKAPQRPDHKVSQSFTDGLLSVFNEQDVSQPGYAPKIAQSEKMRLPYANRKLGIQRYYAAKQAQKEVRRVIRVPRTGNVSILDTVQTEDGAKYRVDLIQAVPDVYPPSDDLTLVVYTQEVSQS